MSAPETRRDRAAGTRRVSLCSLSAGPLHRLAAILEHYRPVVDEIVVAVNGRFEEHELACLDDVADRVVPVEMRADFLQERYRAWLYGLCRGGLVVSVDTDEVPSASLLEALPRLAARDDIVTFLASCRWLYPDAGHFLDEYPWEPSWKMIMVRNDPATLYLRGGVHEGVMAVEPYCYLELPVYHLDCATTSLEEREAKVAFYDSLDGRQLLEDGRAVSEVFYLPERSSAYPPKALPERDRAIVEAVLAADTSRDRVLDRSSLRADAPTPEALLPGTVSYDEVLASWPERSLGEDAYRATIELRHGRGPRRHLEPLFAGEVRPLMVSISNHGSARWLRVMRNRIALSYRFFAVAPDRPGRRGELVLEGGRAPFPCDVLTGDTVLLPIDVTMPSEPGTYLLVIDLVEEQVRWFDQGIERVVEVADQER